MTIIEIKLQKAKQEYEPYKAQEELNRIHELFLMMKDSELTFLDWYSFISITDMYKQTNSMLSASPP